METVFSTSYSIDVVARGLALEIGDGATIIDFTAASAVTDIVINRARMYMNVYYSPEKIALELVVREFFGRLWGSGGIGPRYGAAEPT